MTLNMRKQYIDNLRWLILLILIPYHAAMAWNSWGEPNYIFFEGNRVKSSIIVFFSPYFMPLLFVLSGVSTKFALEKRTNKEYLIERVKRVNMYGEVDATSVASYRSANDLTWHEENDLVHMDLMSEDINGVYGHLGGVSESKQKEQGEDYKERGCKE